jgi:hypothetical protein
MRAAITEMVGKPTKIVWCVVNEVKCIPPETGFSVSAPMLMLDGGQKRQDEESEQ